jgi:hypothetical protein
MLMIYEVWIKDGINLDYFGSWEAAEKYIDEYIEKRAWRGRRMSRKEFEIREKEEHVEE